jgi:hypothetical protein
MLGLLAKPMAVAAELWLVKALTLSAHKIAINYVDSILSFKSVVGNDIKGATVIMYGRYNIIITSTIAVGSLIITVSVYIYLCMR